jgi:hypothetical protein
VIVIVGIAGSAMVFANNGLVDGNHSPHFRYAIFDWPTLFCLRNSLLLVVFIELCHGLLLQPQVQKTIKRNNAAILDRHFPRIDAENWCGKLELGTDGPFPNFSPVSPVPAWVTRFIPRCKPSTIIFK